MSEDEEEKKELASEYMASDEIGRRYIEDMNRELDELEEYLGKDLLTELKKQRDERQKLPCTCDKEQELRDPDCPRHPLTLGEIAAMDRQLFE